MSGTWSASPFAYRRRTTREVKVGDVGIGGTNPIRVQSMTTPATTDIPATVEQIARLVEAGCEIVRVTVPTSNDARALPQIRAALAARRIKVPLVADIHFSPPAALMAVEHVEKVRINPGNFADRKQFAVREYTDADYALELERLANTLRPLIRRAGQLGVALRIGTNHGSLSDRIVNRHGDSPLGMVESALEFVRICESEGFRDLVISMKASNPIVTIQAYRLLAARMDAEGMDYPFHLGVTEAGDGEDGRIKSAIGIGSLLDDGIGDTVRVSLTEDPVEEIPVAWRLVAPYNRRLRRVTSVTVQGAHGIEPGSPAREASGLPAPFDPFVYARRATREVRFGPSAAGGSQPVRVEVRLTTRPTDAAAFRAEIDAHCGPRVPAETRADLVDAEIENELELDRLRVLRATLKLVAPAVSVGVRPGPAIARRILEEAVREPDSLAGAPAPEPHADRIAVRADLFEDVLGPALAPERVPGAPAPPVPPFACLLEGSAEELLGTLGRIRPALAEEGSAASPSLRDRLAVSIPSSPASGAGSGSAVHEVRRLVAGLGALGLDLPVLLAFDCTAPGEDPLLRPSLVLGSLLCDGIGDAVCIRAADSRSSRTMAFGILQGARVRISRTEFISCPSCGRTLFDLEQTTRRIKARTAHLKGLKIAIMGCIVNGPGEMADADFGYVGWGADKIALFVGKELVARDIPTAEADDRLVDLIKSQGKWQDPAPGMPDDADLAPPRAV